MKILHVIANLAPRYGGPSKACVEMAKAVAVRGHKVSIYTTNQDGNNVLPVPIGRTVIDNGVEIKYFPIQSPKFWGTSWPMARALRADLTNYDLVHIHSLYLFHNWITGHLCRKKGIPYIIRPHGSLDPFLYKKSRLKKIIIEKWFENRNIKGASAIHYTTEEELNLARPYTFNVSGIVVPNGLNFNDYTNLPPRGTFSEIYPGLSNKQIILFLSRINFKKGLNILVPAFQKLSKEFPDIHLVIAGPDNEGFGMKVKNWLDEYGVADRTTITGMLTGKNKLAAFRDANIFVLPSYTENFGISVIEAMACGLPVIISDKVNIWREVEKGGAGLIVPTKVKELSEALRKLLLDSRLRQKMGQGGIELVRQNYQWENIGKNLESFYNNIISEKIK